MEKINSCKFCRNVDRAAVALIIPEDSERKHNPKLWYLRGGTADKDGFDQTLYGCPTDRIEIDYSGNVPILMCQTSDGEYEDLGTPIKYCPFCGRRLTNGKENLMKNNEWMLKFKPTTYFDLRGITLKDSKNKYFDRELRYELYDDGNSVPSFKICDLYRDSCTQFDIDELPKLIMELEAAYKQYKDFKENENKKREFKNADSNSNQ